MMKNSVQAQNGNVVTMAFSVFPSAIICRIKVIVASFSMLKFKEMILEK